MGRARRTRRARRGTAIVAILIVLIVLQLAVVAMVTTGARDQELTIARIAGSRAYYASEAGANMALREWVTRTDHDGDGQIGTISDDGNSANDPTVGGASVSVTRTDVDSRIMLLVRARSGNAARQIELTVED